MKPPPTWVIFCCQWRSVCEYFFVDPNYVKRKVTSNHSKGVNNKQKLGH